MWNVLIPDHCLSFYFVRERERERERESNMNLYTTLGSITAQMFLLWCCRNSTEKKTISWCLRFLLLLLHYHYFHHYTVIVLYLT